MPVSVKGSGGGGVTLDAGAAASNTTLTLPNVSGTVLQSGTAVTAAQGGTGLTSTGAAGNVLFTADGSSWSSTAKIVLGTSVASTSGTSIDFTGIPSWVKRVTVMFNGVSTNGTNAFLLQIGSGSFVTSGYASQASTSSVGGVVTSGFALSLGPSAANTHSGRVELSLIGSNTWCESGTIAITSASAICFASAGNSPALSGALDRVRITTVGGTDTFDAGTINIMYE